MQDSFRNIRTLHAVFLVTIVLYAGLGEYVGPTGQGARNSPLYASLIVVSASLLGVGTVLRFRMVGQARDGLRTHPEDSAELRRWRNGHFIPFVMFESVVLFGLMIRFLHGSLPEAAPFYAAGFVALLLAAPRNPVTS